MKGVCTKKRVLNLSYLEKEQREVRVTDSVCGGGIMMPTDKAADISTSKENRTAENI